MIVVEVVAWMPVPLSVTVCVAPSVSPASSVNVSTPLKEPTPPAEKVTVSVQLLDGGSGEAATQFCVELNGPVVATPVIPNGAVPLFVSVTS